MNSEYTWTKNGKTWESPTYVKSALKRQGTIPNDWVVVETANVAVRSVGAVEWLRQQPDKKVKKKVDASCSIEQQIEEILESSDHAGCDRCEQLRAAIAAARLTG